MTDIICTEMNFQTKSNQRAIFHLILNKACEDAILIKNDDVIDLNLEINFYLMLNQKNQQISIQGVILRLLICH